MKYTKIKIESQLKSTFYKNTNVIKSEIVSFSKNLRLLVSPEIPHSCHALILVQQHSGELMLLLISYRIFFYFSFILVLLFVGGLLNSVAEKYYHSCFANKIYF